MTGKQYSMTAREALALRMERENLGTEVNALVAERDLPGLTAAQKGAITRQITPLESRRVEIQASLKNAPPEPMIPLAVTALVRRYLAALELECSTHKREFAQHLHERGAEHTLAWESEALIVAEYRWTHYGRPLLNLWENEHYTLRQLWAVHLRILEGKREEQMQWVAEQSSGAFHNEVAAAIAKGRVSLLQSYGNWMMYEWELAMERLEQYYELHPEEIPPADLVVEVSSQPSVA